MKRLIPFLVLLVPILFSCESKNVPHNPQESENGNKSTTYKDLKIHVLSEEIKKESPYIRLIAEYEGWILLDIAHDGLKNDSSRSFVFLSQTEQVGYYFYVNNNAVLMSQFTNDPTESLFSNNVLLTSFDDEYTYVRVVKDFLGEYKIISERSVKNEQTAMKLPQKHSDYFTGLGKSIYQKMSSHFTSGAEEINNSTGLLGWLPDGIGSAGNTVGTIWSVFAFNASLKQIYDCNPELEEELQEDIEVDNRFFVKMALSSNKYAALASVVHNAISTVSKIGQIWSYEGKITVEEDDYSDVVYPMFSSSRVVNQSPNLQIISSMKPAYVVTHSVDRISENSADVYVSIMPNGYQEYISSMGLVYTNYLTGEKKEIGLSSLSQTVTLTGLSPCTSYMCYAYVTSMSGTYRSSSALFTTEGKLQLIPSSLNFSSLGGTEIVSLSIAVEGVASLKVNGPDWCRLSYNSPAAAFVVTVPKSEIARNGNVEVQVQLIGGETKSAILPISQTADTWDGTNWAFSGEVTTTGPGMPAITGPLEMNLKINNLANNDYTLSTSGTQLSCSLSQESAQVLKGSFSYSYDGITAVWHLTITRTSSTTATCKLDYSLDGVHQFGTLNGVLIE